jgi:PAS domain S-box-containing protein
MRCWVGINLDLTKRKLAEEEVIRLNYELQRRADELQTILDILPVGVAIAHDPRCLRITHNPYMSELLNIPAWSNASLTAPRNERPTTFTNYRNGVEVPTSELPMQQAAAGVEVQDLELDLAVQGRDPRTMLYYARPLFDERGRVRGSVGVCLDVTDRRRAEEALRRTTEQLQNVTESMAAPVTRCSRDLEYVWVSKPYADWLGRPAQEITGRPIVEILGPEAFERLGPYFERVLAGEVVRYEEQVPFRGIGPRWITAVYTPTFDAQGACDGWVAVVNDIDQRKRTEEALRESDRRKDAFLATLAHELRNPLAPIRNAVEVLKAKGTPDPELTWCREVIERQVGQMARLLDDLLDVSRITRNKLELRKERVTLATVLESAVETSRPVIDGGGHELTVSLPSEPVYLDADPVRLAQVFANLLNNAAKYTEGGGRIRLAAERVGQELVVSVGDNGIGIAADVLPRLFRMFSQAKAALERSQGGLGIGLSLVRGLVEMHGGTVEARSGGPGAGSEFVVKLPIAVASAVPEQPPAEVKKPCGVRCKIVVADDNRDAADSLALMLRLKGHEVRNARDGEEAVEAAEAFRPDVVLLDIGMPRLNGYEVARRIREQLWGKDMVLVALTGWGQDEDRRRSEEAGFDTLHQAGGPGPAGTALRRADLESTRTEEEPRGPVEHRKAGVMSTSLPRGGSIQRREAASSSSPNALLATARNTLLASVRRHRSERL